MASGFGAAEDLEGVVLRCLGSTGLGLEAFVFCSFGLVPFLQFCKGCLFAESTGNLLP